MKKNLMLLIFGMVLLVIGFYMLASQQARLETRFRSVVTSNKGHRALVGAAVGGASGLVLGGTAAAVIGGIGITACGTGVGIPAGLVFCGIAALIGGGIGAGVGSLAGAASANTVKSQVPYTVSVTQPMYSHDIGLAVLVVGGLIIIWVVVNHLRQRMLVSKNTTVG